MSSFQGFEEAYTDCSSGARIFSYYKNNVESDSTLPVLVLLHGYPQSSLMFKHFVDEVPPKWRVLVPDLPGYGNSSKPISENSYAHSKRAWGQDIMRVVDVLFGSGTPIIPFGHDRGARLAYRLALDFGEQRVKAAACLDIVPTIYVWDNMRLERGHNETMRSHHWITLAAPRPLPEKMISANPRFYFEFTLTSWTRSDANTEWIHDAVAPYLDAEKGYDRIVAACEDYRAGATLDVYDDRAALIDPYARRTASPGTEYAPVFTCPLLILYSHHLGRRFDVDGIWSSLGLQDKVSVRKVGDETTGHFLVNERQEETGRLMREWLDGLSF